MAYKIFNSFEVVAYFTARLMYSLNNYAKEEGEYYDSDKTDLYRGIKLPYSSILKYERAMGKIIAIPYFISTSEEVKISEMFS